MCEKNPREAPPKIVNDDPIIKGETVRAITFDNIKTPKVNNEKLADSKLNDLRKKQLLKELFSSIKFVNSFVKFCV